MDHPVSQRFTSVGATRSSANFASEVAKSELMARIDDDRIDSNRTVDDTVDEIARGAHRTASEKLDFRRAVTELVSSPMLIALAAALVVGYVFAHL